MNSNIYGAINIQTMRQPELQAYGQELMKAYTKGGSQEVMGAMMTKSEIFSELKAVGAELKDRASR